MAEATADVRIVIQRPVSEVFAYMADYNNNVHWQEGVIRSEQVTPGPPRAGIVVRYVRRLMGREVETTSTMTTHDPDRALRMSSDAGLFTYQGGYDFAPDGEGATRIHYHGTITTGRLMGFVGKAVAGKFESQMSSDLARLKRLLEGGG
jgi:uncharacterized membrane protein